MSLPLPKFINYIRLKEELAKNPKAVFTRMDWNPNEYFVFLSSDRSVKPPSAIQNILPDLKKVRYPGELMKFSKGTISPWKPSNAAKLHMGYTLR